MSSFSISMGPATLNLGHTLALPNKVRPLVWELTELSVPPEERNKGWGSKLLQHVCERADATKMVLLLHVEPQGDDGMTQEQLMNWYSRFDFTKLQDDPLLMVRPHQAYRTMH